MPTADLRVFRCESDYDANGELVVVRATLDKRRPIDVWVPSLLKVNTLAAPLRRRMAYRVKQHELNLVLSFLSMSKSKNSRVRARVGDLKSAARHIGAFVTESVGMGMLTATVSDHFRWPGNHDDLEHFDTLPARFAGDYHRRGVRPDLLFLDPAVGISRMAGEARGRSTRPPRKMRPTAEQRRRLNQMLGWSERHNYHPVTMAWTCLGGPALAVDLFDVTLPPSGQRRPPSAPASEPPPGSRVPDAEVEGPRSIATAGDASGGGIVDPQGERTNERLADRSYHAVDGTDESGFSGMDFEMGMRAYARNFVDYLYETAPENGRQVLDDEPVRGGWVKTDLVGSSKTHLFLGVLRSEQLEDRQDTLRRRRLEGGWTDDIQVDVFGRLIVAVALDSATASSWEQVSTRLE
ncbi:hypothetical protein [Amycolatopsis coloradensis]|uniref:hypothetical protein n=1 Tax=Amycolatopsis coloradensis TaxID=76021 RepID=UPI0011778490|nr:hypothetical protein [Amycolatopsis coloradensis]